MNVLLGARASIFGSEGIIVCCAATRTGDDYPSKCRIWVLKEDGRIIDAKSNEVIIDKKDVDKIFRRQREIQEEILSRSEILDL